MRRRWTTSKLLAVGILLVDGAATTVVLALCGLAVWRGFTGTFMRWRSLMARPTWAAGTSSRNSYQGSSRMLSACMRPCRTAR